MCRSVFSSNSPDFLLSKDGFLFILFPFQDCIHNCRRGAIGLKCNIRTLCGTELSGFSLSCNFSTFACIKLCKNIFIWHKSKYTTLLAIFLRWQGYCGRLYLYLLSAWIISRAIISEPDPGPEIGLKEVVLRCVEAAPGTSLPSSGEEGGCQEMC